MHAPQVVMSVAAGIASSPSPSPSPSATASAGSGGDSSAWIAAIAGIAAALITALIAAVVAYGQIRSNRRLEREKLGLQQQHEKEKLTLQQELEKEKLKIQEELARGRVVWEDQRKEAAEREAEAHEFDERLKAQAAQADARQQRAIRYRRMIVDRLRNLKILDMSRSLDLDRLYVQVQVRKEESPRFLSEEEIERSARGEPEKLLQVSREHLRTASAEAIRPEEALSRFGRIVVLGDPGAGKTTMLRYLTFRAAREEIGPAISLPIYVELRDFIDSGHADLLIYAADELAQRYGFPDAKPYLEQELADGRAVLLLDGLDEVLGGDNEEAASAAYLKVAAEADRLATLYPAAPIALTCRKAGWRGGMPQFTTLEVLDFDWSEIEKFIGNWFADNSVKATGLRDKLSANLRMQTLAANPLLLSLIAIVYERDLELPERRAELYNRCVEVLLKDWDAHREIKRFSRFTTDRKRDLLEEVAWTFHRAGRRYFPAGELLAIIREFLPTIDIEASNAEAILDEIVAQYGLLKVQAHGWYGFLHLTLQEYFAAVAANERGLTAVAEVTRFRHDPWWEEVILLLAGRMADASPLLLGLLGRDADAPEPPTTEALAARDDLFRGDLLMAGRCLATRPRVRKQWLRNRLMSELMRLLLESPYAVVYERAARTLADIGGEGNQEALLGLVADTTIGVGRRSEVIRALGDAGDDDVAPKLFAMFQRIGWDQGFISSEIAEALAKLRFSKAAPAVMRHLEAGDVDEYSALFSLTNALGAFGDRSIKSDVWNLLERWGGQGGDDDGFARARLLRLIGRIGDGGDVDRLLTLIGGDRSINIAALDAAAKLSDGAIASSLYRALLNPETNAIALEAILGRLRILRRPDVLESIFSVIADASIDWRLRWLSADLIAIYPRQACEARVVRVFEDPTLDERVRVRVAAALAGWDNPIGLDCLRQAFTGGWIMNRVVIGADGASSSFSSAIPVAEALYGLGDKAVPVGLLAEYRRLVSTREGVAVSSADDELLDVLAEFKSAELVQDIVRGRLRLDWREGEIIANAMTKEVIPVIFEAMEAGHSFAESLPDVLRELSEIADSSDDAARLLALLLRGSGVDHDADEIAYALEEVSRRARVRVFADGTVEPL
jgi:hypothetical protein